MTIAKTAVPSNLTVSPNPMTTDLGLDVEVPDLDETSEDGGLTVDLGEDEGASAEAGEFTANLADHMPNGGLRSLAGELLRLVEADKMARKDWEKAYSKGLDLLGFKIEERQDPWAGASGVFHPVLAEAVIKFQAQAIMEIFPAAGPARVVVVGKEDEQKLKQAQRVQDELNYQLTQKMTEYRGETEQLLFHLPMSGSALKKVYFDPKLGRQTSVFVPAQEFIVPYGTSDLLTCERYAQEMRRTKNQVKAQQRAGFYRDVDIPEPTPDYSQLNKIQEKSSKITGEFPSVEVDDRHILYEIHADLVLSDYEFTDPLLEEDADLAVPYIVTVEKASQEILGIRRNWKQEDKLKAKSTYFVHYQYLPGFGFYGTGMIHLIGGLAKSATSILRQLIDAGTLSNLPAGFKARGLRIKEDNSPLRPGEFRDVDVPGQAIRDGIFPLPIKEPSAVLAGLLANVVDEARKIGSVADLDIADVREGMPVGTTLALLERSMKVMSAVQARLHAAMRIELGMIAEIIKGLGDTYDYQIEGEFKRAEDFSSANIDIIPVSDPNASTMAQRVVQYQTVIELASRQPDLYNMPELHRGMLDQIGIKNAERLVKLPDDFKPMDPVSENMAILTGMPVKAFMYQDNKAHIAAHLAFAQDPKIQQMVGQSPRAALVQGAMAAHIAEHLAYEYRQEIEQKMGVQMPAPNANLPEDVEVQLSQLVAQAGQKLLGQHQSEAAQAQAQQQQEDPLFKLQMMETQTKAAEVMRKSQKDAADLSARAAELRSRDEEVKLKAVVDLLTAHMANQSSEAQAGVSTVLEIINGIVDAKKHVTQVGTQHAQHMTRLDHEKDMQAQQLASQEKVAAMKPAPKPNGAA